MIFLQNKRSSFPIQFQEKESDSLLYSDIYMYLHVWIYIDVLFIYLNTSV